MSPVCWHLRGRLTNTATGRTIALVEGVELCRSLAFEVATRNGRSSVGKDHPVGSAAGTGRELELDTALRPGAWSAFGALATSKFFMYQDPETGEPMETYRNTPVDRKVPVRTYESLSQVVSHVLKPSGQILVISEWGGRSVKAETVNRNGVEEIGGGIVAGDGGGKRGAGPRRVFNLHFFVEARTPKEERELKRRLSRPGSKWVAFGSTPPRSQGCKEAYSYVTGAGDGAPAEAESNGGSEKQQRKPTTTLGLMSYTRYGECPSWYGAGRMCGLDLQAKRIESFAALPAKLRRKVLEVDPDFGRGPPATLEECRAKAAEERQELEKRRRRRRRSWRRPFGILSAEDRV